MSDRITTLSALAKENLLEVGAGRPRTVNTDQHPPLTILRVADVLDGGIDPSLRGNVADAQRKEKEPKISRPGDVVLTVKGTVGRVALMPMEGPDFAYSPQLCYFRPVVNGPLVPRYLYYWLRSAEFWSQANALKGQTDMADYISLSDVGSLKIRVPSLREQAGMVDVLGTLDDKIAVNERIAATGDELASAMYADLMARCVSTDVVELGMVAVVNEQVVKPGEVGELRYIDISSVNVGSYEWPEKIAWCDAPGRARRAAVFGSTIWSTVRPNRRSHALVLDDDPDLVFSTGLAVLTPTSVGPSLFYEATRRPEFQSYLEGVAEGSTYPAVRADRFKNAPVFLPHPSEREKFEETSMEIRVRAHQAARESRTLAALRDVLLPQLMSGRIRIKDAEKIVEEST